MVVNTGHRLTTMGAPHNLTDILDLASVGTTWRRPSAFRDKVSSSKTETVAMLVEAMFV
jgi:hypothetical protein